ncbi:unnamed protein product [Gongylonema pulchrum]|uniref:Uncharacterized protein n=1 Tax=Gongylonema pulchrum TaxID=637853 RepID=A0A3P6Q2B6_9BILA|nr:unnamed protein product [Gongylonema pulchrum]
MATARQLHFDRSEFQVFTLGWTYVHAIAVSGSYGERGIDSFRAAANDLGVCIDGDVHKINRHWSDAQFRFSSTNVLSLVLIFKFSQKELILKMKHTKKARGVVMFVDEDHLRRMLSSLDALIRNDSTLNNYFW